MTDFEKEIIEGLDRLEREVIFLRASVSVVHKKDAVRVYPAEIARRFGVSDKTIRRMQGDFAGLAILKKTTETGRIYFNRKEYEKWLADRERRAANPRRLLMRR